MFFAVVTRIDFDSMENNMPRVYSLAAVFVSDDLARAGADAACWIADRRSAAKLFEGYDGAMYPTWYTQTGECGKALDKAQKIFA